VALGQLGQGAGDALGPLAPQQFGVSRLGADVVEPGACRLGGALPAEAVAQQVGRDAAQPAGEGAGGRVEVAGAAHGRQPGLLHDLVGGVAQPAAAPQDVAEQAVETLVVPGAPGGLVAGQHGAAQGLLAPDALARFHDCAPAAPPRYCH
jgi:hypothetical protein